MKHSIVWSTGKAIALTMFVGVASATAGETLFPEPLHLVRQIDDPVAGRVATIDEYFDGNRVVVISRDRFTVTDFATQEVLEVDRTAGTFSVTSFDEIARASAAIGESAAPSPAWRATGTPSTRTGSTNRILDVFEFENDAAIIEVAFDREVFLTRGGLDVLLGAAYPNVARPEHELIANRARRADRRVVTTGVQSRAKLHALPAEQKMTFKAGSERIVIRNVVVGVSSDRVTSDAVALPVGARRVESPLIRLAREFQLLDRVRVPVR